MHTDLDRYSRDRMARRVRIIQQLIPIHVSLGDLSFVQYLLDERYRLHVAMADSGGRD